MSRDKGSGVEIVGQLLRRIETLAVDLDRMRVKKEAAEERSNFALNMERQSADAVPHLKSAMLELKRLKKKHPRLVRLPVFMRPVTDDDIPF